MEKQVNFLGFIKCNHEEVWSLSASLITYWIKQDIWSTEVPIYHLCLSTMKKSKPFCSTKNNLQAEVPRQRFVVWTSCYNKSNINESITRHYQSCFVHVGSWTKGWIGRTHSCIYDSPSCLVACIRTPEAAAHPLSRNLLASQYEGDKAVPDN